jgi:uroporphyrin-III C-methyltransferase
MTKAYLVGAGPGDPRLLTIAAVEAIQMADLILCDRLVSKEIVALAKPHCHIVYVGKHPGEQEAVQKQIFDYFLEYADRNDVVVRLKGGDSYVFGRGAEEYIVLKQLGYDVTVIPGISSAIGVPALAGIPVTARGLAASFAVVTGHCCGEAQVVWHKYVHIDTLVVLMGVSERAVIAQELISAGRDPFEPIAFVENGSSASQRVVRSTLGAVRDGLVQVSSPAVFVIGAVTRIYEEIESRAKTSSRPLVEPFLLSTASSELINNHVGEADITLCELSRSADSAA